MPKKYYGGVKMKIDTKLFLLRLRTALNAKSNVQLAKILDVPYSTLNTWLTRNSLPVETIISKSVCDNISIDFLLDKTIPIYNEALNDFEKYLKSVIPNWDTEISRQIDKYLERVCNYEVKRKEGRFVYFEDLAEDFENIFKELDRCFEPLDILNNKKGVNDE